MNFGTACELGYVDLGTIGTKDRCGIGNGGLVDVWT